MPLTVAELVRIENLTAAMPVRWGTAVPEGRGGVYFITRTRDASAVPDAMAAPTTDPPSIAAWLPQEPVLYIGKATSLRKRVGQFYRHRYGAPSPHRGGQRLKLLAIMDELWVHWAVCESPPGVEERLLRYFRQSIGRLPFANIRN